MRVWRIYNTRLNDYYGSLRNVYGFYLSLKSAEKALAQYKNKRWFNPEVIVIKEFELKEII